MNLASLVYSILCNLVICNDGLTQLSNGLPFLLDLSAQHIIAACILKATNLNVTSLTPFVQKMPNTCFTKYALLLSKLNLNKFCNSDLWLQLVNGTNQLCGRNNLKLGNLTIYTASRFNISYCYPHTKYKGTYSIVTTLGSHKTLFCMLLTTLSSHQDEFYAYNKLFTIAK